MPRNTGNFPLARALSALILLSLALAFVRSATAFDGTRIHGRVIHPRGGTLPFDEMDVRLRVDGELHATVPDAEGRFSFDFDEPPTSSKLPPVVPSPRRASSSAGARA